MAAEQGISIADDGVAEVSMTHARANLTALIRDVRYGGRTAAFTERGARSAYVVPPEFYERAAKDRAFMAQIERAFEEAGSDEERVALGEELVRRFLMS
ncbi:type II toxin-antitoxin system prevent-host-death family antitoxin [Streptomyces sp. NPDC057336]|uniref:type II toxin-antitoxin system prevent-host-death family antitoxin n=1 Tax=Streptomyces sp. NPDC057336 TaxID=3346102 RepID=UPI0036279EDD